MGVNQLNRDIRKEKEPRTVTRTEQTFDGFTNPDGTPNTAALAELEKGTQRLASSYHVNPETGRVEPKYLSDIIGFDPDLSRKRREEEEALNRRKAKEAAWVNGLSVLSDMITTAAGGNVNRREALQNGKTAHADNLALRKEQQAEDAAIAGKVQSVEKAYAEGVQKLRDTIGKAYSTKKSSVSYTGGDIHETGYREAFPPVGRVGGGSSNRHSDGSPKTNKTMNVNIYDGNKLVKRNGYNLTTQEYDAVSGLLKAHYNTLVNERDAQGNLTQRAELLRKELLRAAVLKKTVDGSKKDIEQNEFDVKQLLTNGDYFALDDALKARIEAATGNKIQFPRKGKAKGTGKWTPSGNKSNSATSDLV